MSLNLSKIIVPEVNIILAIMIQKIVYSIDFFCFSSIIDSKLENNKQAAKIVKISIDLTFVIPFIKFQIGLQKSKAMV